MWGRCSCELTKFNKINDYGYFFGVNCGYYSELGVATEPVVTACVAYR
jgi:hypothetical protein